MNNERWQQFVDLAQSQFDSVEVYTEDIIFQTEDGPQKQGTKDVLSFERGGVAYKLERENRPVVLDKKMHFAKRATDTARTEYVLSETEFSHKLRVYREKDNGDWEEISTESLGL